MAGLGKKSSTNGCHVGCLSWHTRDTCGKVCSFSGWQGFLRGCGGQPGAQGRPCSLRTSRPLRQGTAGCHLKQGQPNACCGLISCQKSRQSCWHEFKVFTVKTTFCAPHRFTMETFVEFSFNTQVLNFICHLYQTVLTMPVCRLSMSD